MEKRRRVKDQQGAFERKITYGALVSIPNPLGREPQTQSMAAGVSYLPV